MGYICICVLKWYLVYLDREDPGRLKPTDHLADFTNRNFLKMELQSAKKFGMYTSKAASFSVRIFMIKIKQMPLLQNICIFKHVEVPC